MGFTKTIDLSGREYLEAGEHRIVPLSYSREYEAFELDSRRTKTAASEDALAYAAKIKPVPGRRVILVSALGDFESWGDNKKADAFPYNALQGLNPSDVSTEFFKQYSHRIPKMWGRACFPTRYDDKGNQIGGGNTFHEHINRYPKQFNGQPLLDEHTKTRRRGDTRCGYILAEFWNEKMRRVELIQEVWEHALPHMVKAIDEGFLPGISMACDIPFDRCSICGHLSINESSYCIHLQRSNNLRGVVTPEGKPVVMINDYPEFFDSSIVQSKAAGEAGTLLKVASIHILGTRKNINTLPVEEKQANTKGRLLLCTNIQKHRESEVPFSEKVASALREYPLTHTVTYLGCLGIYPTGEDLANIMFGKQANTRVIGQQADKYLLGVLGNKVKIASSENKAIQTSLSSDDSLPNEKDFEKVATLVSSYIALKSHVPPFRDPYGDGSFMGYEGQRVDLSVPFNQMDERVKAVILAKIFTDAGLHQAVQQLICKPSVSMGLDKLGLDAIYSNSKKYLPVYDDLAKDYLGRSGLDAERFKTYY